MLALNLLFYQVQLTVVQKYLKAKWRCTKNCKLREVYIIGRKHYRLVLATVGRPLRDFKDAKELFGAGLNIVEGTC